MNLSENPDGYNVPFSPIEGIPREVLGLIFSERLQDAYRNPVPPTLGRKHPAVIVSHVCRLWRHIAFTSPKFWDHIYIVRSRYCYPISSLSNITNQIIDEWNGRSSQLRGVVDFWILRSSPCLLHISLYDLDKTVDPAAMPQADRDFIGEHLIFVTDALCQVSDRWLAHAGFVSQDPWPKHSCQMFP